MTGRPEDDGPTDSQIEDDMIERDIQWQEERVAEDDDQLQGAQYYSDLTYAEGLQR